MGRTAFRRGVCGRCRKRAADAAKSEARTAALAYLMTLPRVLEARGLELDRIDVDGNYEPGNLRFISRAENARNKRRPNDLSARIAALEAKIKEMENARSF